MSANSKAIQSEKVQTLLKNIAIGELFTDTPSPQNADDLMAILQDEINNKNQLPEGWGLTENNEFMNPQDVLELVEITAASYAYVCEKVIRKIEEI